MSYHHISTFERGHIEVLLRLGYSNRKIATIIGRHHSRIDREVNRKTSNEVYQTEMAEQSYHCHRENRTNGKISFKTIYNWLYAGKLSYTNVKLLRQNGKRRKTEKRGKFSMGTSISQRPNEVKTRGTFGHWELDTMVSSHGKEFACYSKVQEELDLTLYFADAYSSWQR